MKREIRTMFKDRGDWPKVISLDAKCYALPWTKEQLEECFKLRRASVGLGKVCEINGRLAGYLIYTVKEKEYVIRRLGVHPECRRMYVATQLLREVTNRMSPDGRTVTICEVHERDLPGQLFLRSQGFKCVGIRKVEGLDDYYRMELSVCTNAASYKA